MNLQDVMIQRQITSAILQNFEWRIAIEDFINHHAGVEGFWEADISTHGSFLKIYSTSGLQTEQLRFSPIGVYDTEGELWSWLWSSITIPSFFLQKTKAILQYGHTHHIDAFTIPQASVSPSEAELYNLLVASIYSPQKPVVWLPMQEKLLCVLIEEELSLPEVTYDTFAAILEAIQHVPHTLYDLQQAIKDYGEYRNCIIAEGPDGLQITLPDSTIIKLSV